MDDKAIKMVISSFSSDIYELKKKVMELEAVVYSIAKLIKESVDEEVSAASEAD